MPCYKDKERNTWYVSCYYSKNGKRVIHKKRGFSTKREALEHERKFLEQHHSDVEDMTLNAFWEIYLKDMKVRLRENTINTKRYIVEKKILPQLGNMKMSEIKASDIRKWQNELMNQGFKGTYLKTVNTQLVAIFNYAMRYYDLRENCCKKAGSMGTYRAEEMQFWIKEEFDTFIKGISDKPQSVVAFKLLFMTGMRCGKLLALTYEDFSFEDNTVSITKSYQRINKRDIVTPPKNKYSIRTIALPKALMAEIEAYIGLLYGFMKEDRIFPFTKSFLEHEMERGTKATGTKKIRIHDLRHSHASFLLANKVPILAISKSLGHCDSSVTLRVYSHLAPSENQELEHKLNELFSEEE